MPGPLPAITAEGLNEKYLLNKDTSRNLPAEYRITVELHSTHQKKNNCFQTDREADQTVEKISREESIERFLKLAYQGDYENLIRFLQSGTHGFSKQEETYWVSYGLMRCGLPAEAARLLSDKNSLNQEELKLYFSSRLSELRHYDNVMRNNYTQQLSTEGKDIGFLHIPKCGGTAIVDAFQGRCINLGHRVLASGPAPLSLYDSYALVVPPAIQRPENLPVFTSIKNIFDFLVSFFYYSIWEGENTVQSLFHFSGEYIEKCRKGGLDYFIKNAVEKYPWTDKQNIFFQVFDAADPDSLAVDYIVRLESAQEDINAMKDCFPVSPLPLVRKNTTKSREEEDYRKYYTTELVDIVHRTWEKDIEYFGFAFETPYVHKNGVLWRDVRNRRRPAI